MKKLFIGLLVIAAGAGIYFLLISKDKPIAVHEFQEEEIVGRWKLDSIHFFTNADSNLLEGIMSRADSDMKKYQYYFAKDGTVSFSVGDSIIKDSSQYEWNKERQLIWKEKSTDSAGDIFRISILNKDSLALESKDSTLLMFLKVK